MNSLMFCSLLYLSRFSLGYYVGYPTQTGQATVPHFRAVTVQGRMPDCQDQETGISGYPLPPVCSLLHRNYILPAVWRSFSGDGEPLLLNSNQRHRHWLLSFSALAKQESVFMCRRKMLEHNRNFKVKVEEPLEWGTSRVKQMLSKGFQDHSSGFKHLNSF